MTKLNVLRIIKFIKEAQALQHIKIILGGPEVRNHKEKFLEYGADVIVFGEGEDTMLELVKYFTEDTNTLLHDIAGIAFKDDGHVVVSVERVLIRDINQLSFPIAPLPRPTANISPRGLYLQQRTYSSQSLKWLVVLSASEREWRTLHNIGQFEISEN